MITCFHIRSRIIYFYISRVRTWFIFLQEQFDNGLFLPKYEKSSVMPLQVHLQYIGKITQAVYLLLKLKELLIELNILIFPSVFYQNNLTMVSFFQNIKSPFSCRKICAKNHVQILSSAVVLNGLLDSYFIRLVRQNTINS